MSKPREEAIEGLNSNVEQGPEILGLGERGLWGPGRHGMRLEGYRSLDSWV